MNAHHESKHSKFIRVGGSVGLCVGLAVGATSLLGCVDKDIYIYI